MKTLLRNKIRSKLKNYKVPLNTPDPSAPRMLSGEKRVAVAGAGIAGMVAALSLAERGFRVTLFEKASYLGGKIGSWTFESGGETLRTTHGFHAFFNQYYNLLALMQRLELDRNLVEIDDYVVLFNEHEKQHFKGIDPTPVFNILDLRKRGVFNVLTLINPLSIPLLQLLRYNPDTTFRRYDKESFTRFARRTLMPRKMRVVFNSFARAFFAEPHKMSMAELMKSFHFYFLSNEGGLLYKSLNDDFEYTFLRPFEQRLKALGVDIRMQTPLESLQKTEQGFRLNGEDFDYCILATDVKGTSALLQQAEGLEPADAQQLASLKATDRYAVYRIWTDRFEGRETPYFVMTDKRRALDSITFFHLLEKESAEWSRVHGGGIFELHSYSLPDDLRDEQEIRRALLDEFYIYFPELKGLRIVHEYFQHRDDFPAFHTGQHALRPSVCMQTPGLYCAGDWVRMRTPVMLMEAACTSAQLAANEILRQNGLQETALFGVPEKGLLA
ncbi:MAG: FAD-dependent oxidoreductase [Flavobacteriales bacterium]